MYWINNIFLYLLNLTKTPLNNFVYQYILFPLTIGEGRLTSSETAYISFLDQMNLKRLLGDFKFIHFLLVPLIFFTFKNYKKNSTVFNLLNVTFILSVFALIFNQLITANQIYIFSLIPILAALIHLNINNSKISSKYISLILIVVIFATIKFHQRYNIERKFHDLENIDKTNAINANEIHQNLNNLKWISNDVPETEVELLKYAIDVIDFDEREKF